MYPEFMAIYIGLGILSVLLVIVLILVLSILKKLKAEPMIISTTKSQGSIVQTANQSDNNKSTSTGVIFCKKCSNQFESNLNNCPHCGATR